MTIGDNQLKSFVDRYQTLLQEEAAIKADQKELGAEIKEARLDAAAVKKLAQLAIDPEKVQKERGKNQTLAHYNNRAGTNLDLGHEITVGEIIDDDERDRRIALAVELILSRKSIRFVKDATNLGHGTVQRLRSAVLAGVPGVPPQNGTPGTPAHDPETGELTEPAATDPTPAVFCAGDSIPRTVAVAAVPEMQGGLAPTQSPSGESVPERVPAPAGDTSPSTKRGPETGDPATAEVAPARVEGPATTSTEPPDDPPPAAPAAAAPSVSVDDFDGDRDMPSFLRRAPRNDQAA